MTKLNSTIDSSPVALQARGVVVLVLIVGIGLSLGAFFFWRGVENDRMQIVFREAAHDRIHHLESDIESSLETLLAISALFGASKEVERLEFRAFTEPFLSRFRGVQALEWKGKTYVTTSGAAQVVRALSQMPKQYLPVMLKIVKAVNPENKRTYYAVE